MVRVLQYAQEHQDEPEKKANRSEEMSRTAAPQTELVTPPSGDNNAAGLRFAMHEVLIYERFALEAARSREFRNSLSTHFAKLNNQVEKGIVETSRAEGESDDLIAFKIEKWNSIFMPTPTAQATIIKSAVVATRIDNIIILYRPHFWKCRKYRHSLYFSNS